VEQLLLPPDQNIKPIKNILTNIVIC
jgi:hypothetical protein